MAVSTGMKLSRIRDDDARMLARQTRGVSFLADPGHEFTVGDPGKHVTVLEKCYATEHALLGDAHRPGEHRTDTGSKHFAARHGASWWCGALHGLKG